MKTRLAGFAIAAVLALLAQTASAQNGKPLKACALDAVVSGTLCMDRYEASVWRVPNPTTTNRALVEKLQDGSATSRPMAGDAVHLGVANDDYAPCETNGQNCANDIYAVSLPGVSPSGHATWFQAQVACENSRKRLPTNAEWQAAATGTPDAGSDDHVADCNTSGPASSLTGSRSRCVSADGAYDMVGNLYEWVSDWVPKSTVCGTWSPDVDATGDAQCLAGAATNDQPGALLRGGNYNVGTQAGPLAVAGKYSVTTHVASFGFRCAR